jgi:hypothetical protein
MLKINGPICLRQIFGASLIELCYMHGIELYVQRLFEFSIKLYLVLISVLLLKDVVANELWRTVDSNGWRASSAPRICWPRKFIQSYAILSDGKMKF